MQYIFETRKKENMCPKENSAENVIDFLPGKLSSDSRLIAGAITARPALFS